MEENPNPKETQVQEPSVTSDQDQGVIIGDNNRGGMKLSTSIAIQIVGIIVAAAISLTSVQARVEHLQQAHDAADTVSVQILRRVAELQAKVDYMADELRYIRTKTDRIAERGK